MPRLEAEGTDCYRLFHGVAEGRPGLMVDRYGPVVLVQVASHLPLEAVEIEALKAHFPHQPTVWTSRRGSRLEFVAQSMPGLWEARFSVRELGLEFFLEFSKAHRDPQIFLDFRAAKRSLRALIEQWDERPLSLLNLFAYTCSISCHALASGADSVVSVDFSAGNLAWGQRNARRNRLREASFLECDCVAALWAWSGNRRALARHKIRLGAGFELRQFSIVVVDPPAFSKGKYATVDLVNDPETVFGPAWDVVAPGGLLVAANNSAKVGRDEFEGRLRRMAAKRGAPIAWIARVSPDLDFPSFDGEPPLKVAFCRKPS